MDFYQSSIRPLLFCFDPERIHTRTLQAARGIPTGGIPIPSGSGSTAINRPGPAGSNLTFDNTTSTTLPAIVPGQGLGPTVSSQRSDIITFLMTDTLLGALSTNTGLAGQATLAADGSSLAIGSQAAWKNGNPAGGVPAVAVGDLLWLSNSNGGTLQTVTAVDASRVYFGLHDWFNFNQPGAEQGSVSQIVANPMPQGSVSRVLMLTYYVDASSSATPRLTRVRNSGSPEALAGVFEELEFFYDIVDGATNPTLQDTTSSPNQIRKVTIHLGVRSDTLSPVRNDYVRNHVSTALSIRSLAYFDRYVP